MHAHRDRDGGGRVPVECRDEIIDLVQTFLDRRFHGCWFLQCHRSSSLKRSDGTTIHDQSPTKPLCNAFFVSIQTRNLSGFSWRQRSLHWRPTASSLINTEA